MIIAQLNDSQSTNSLGSIVLGVVLLLIVLALLRNGKR